MEQMSATLFKDKLNPLPAAAPRDHHEEEEIPTQFTSKPASSSPPGNFYFEMKLRRSFPEKLYDLINKLSREKPWIAEWTEDGDAFLVMHEETFLLRWGGEKAMWKSFMKQLNKHGFKHDSGNNKAICMCWHNNFKRDEPDLLKNIISMVRREKQIQCLVLHDCKEQKENVLSEDKDCKAKEEKILLRDDLEQFSRKNEGELLKSIAPELKKVARQEKIIESVLVTSNVFEANETNTSRDDINYKAKEEKALRDDVEQIFRRNEHDLLKSTAPKVKKIVNKGKTEDHLIDVSLNDRNVKKEKAFVSDDHKTEKEKALLCNEIMEKERWKSFTKQLDDRNLLEHATLNGRKLLCKDNCKDVAVGAMDEEIKDLERRINSVDFDFDARLEHYLNGISKDSVDKENADGENIMEFKDAESREIENFIDEGSDFENSKNTNKKRKNEMNISQNDIRKTHDDLFFDCFSDYIREVESSNGLDIDLFYELYSDLGSNAMNKEASYNMQKIWTARICHFQDKRKKKLQLELASLGHKREMRKIFDNPKEDHEDSEINKQKGEDETRKIFYDSREDLQDSETNTQINEEEMRKVCYDPEEDCEDSETNTQENKKGEMGEIIDDFEKYLEGSETNKQESEDELRKVFHDFEKYLGDSVINTQENEEEARKIIEDPEEYLKDSETNEQGNEDKMRKIIDGPEENLEDSETNKQGSEDNMSKIIDEFEEYFEDSETNKEENEEIIKLKANSLTLREKLEKVECLLKNRDAEVEALKLHLENMEEELKECVAKSEEELKNREELIIQLKIQHDSTDMVLKDCWKKLEGVLKERDEKIDTINYYLKKAQNELQDGSKERADKLKAREKEVCVLKDKLREQVAEHKRQLEGAKKEREDLVEEFRVVIKEYRLFEGDYKKEIDKWRSESRDLQRFREEASYAEVQNQYIARGLQALRRREAEVQKQVSELNERRERSIVDQRKVWTLGMKSRGCGSFFKRLALSLPHL